MIMAKEKNLA